MPKSPFLKKSKTAKSRALENRRKQKFAIWDYYKKKNQESPKAPKKPK